MATQHGRLEEFHPESDSIKAYLERVTLYFTANAVDNGKRVAVLLSSIGAPTYSLLSDLVAPHLPSTKSFDEISEALRNHYEPKRAIIAERFHFHKRDQAAGETIAEFDAALRKLATHCLFGGALEDTLRDRFVCGLRHESIQRRLLSEKDLKYRDALGIARAMGTADRNTKSLKSTEPAIRKFTSHSTSYSARVREKDSCYRCGRTNHSTAECKFKDAECYHCGKKGHIAPACRSKAKPIQPTHSLPKSAGVAQGRRRSKKNHRRTHHVHKEVEASISDSDASSGEGYHLHKLHDRSSNPINVPVLVNGRQLEMELDTGAAVSIISDETRKTLFADQKLRKSTLVLKTYTEEPMQVVGQLNVRVKYGVQEAKLVLVVVGGNGPSLFGRNWLKYLRLDWRNIAVVRAVQQKSLSMLLKQHQQLFTDELGKVEPYKATLQVQPDAIPRFFKPRSMPFAIKASVGKELDRLEQQGIIEKVSHSEWAAPIVAVPKKDGRFRICGDYKVTINQALAVEQYPLPKSEDLFATLAGGTVFSKLDLSQAYLQVQLDEKSTPYVTINTHQGLYHHKRLPFGIASAPALFQKLMDEVLRGIPDVFCYIDDILVSGKDEKSHLKSLEEVFRRLGKHGFRLKPEKCGFLLSSVEYLGHQISKDGICALPSKVAAINKAPAPTNVQELRSFLGLLNYYGKFMPNLATVLHPLNALLQTDREWTRSKECDKAFKCAKEQLTSGTVLTHYDSTLPIKSGRGCFFLWCGCCYLSCIP